MFETLSNKISGNIEIQRSQNEDIHKNIISNKDKIHVKSENFDLMHTLMDYQKAKWGTIWRVKEKKPCILYHFQNKNAL